MEVVELEFPARKSANGTTHQYDWLQATLSGVDEKMKAILDLLENDLSPWRNAEIQETNKETVKKMVQDLSLSYCSLAKKYERLKSVSRYALTSTSPSPSNNQTSQFDGRQDKLLSGSLYDSQLEVIYSNPESTVEDVDIEQFGITHDFEHQKTIAHELASKDEGSIKQECAWMDMEKLKMLKLVEEHAQLQVELIRRNTEKREIIRKLQNQVSQLESQNNARQHSLSYKQSVEVDSRRKKATLIDKFSTGSSKMKPVCQMKTCFCFPLTFSASKRTRALRTKPR